LDGLFFLFGYLIPGLLVLFDRLLQLNWRALPWLFLAPCCLQCGPLLLFGRLLRSLWRLMLVRLIATLLLWLPIAVHAAPQLRRGLLRVRARVARIAFRLWAYA